MTLELGLERHVAVTPGTERHCRPHHGINGDTRKTAAQRGGLGMAGETCNPGFSAKNRPRSFHGDPPAEGAGGELGGNVSDLLAHRSGPSTLRLNSQQNRSSGSGSGLKSVASALLSRVGSSFTSLYPSGRCSFVDCPGQHGTESRFRKEYQKPALTEECG